MRSKRKQKLKRERKVKYRAKEVETLKDMLRKAGEKVDGETDAVMVDPETLKTAKAKKAAQLELAAAAEEEVMDTQQKSEFGKTSLKNEHGNYPVWMNRRQIKRHKKLTSKSKAEGYTKGRKRKRL